MKRGLVFSLCALVAAASASTAMAQATISASLNLRYTDPADPSEGGTWTLVAKTDDDDGIAALVAYLSNAGNVASTDIATNIGAIDPVGNPPGPALLDRTGGVLEIVYGQDMTAAGTVLDVGQPNFGPRIVSDPLKNATWNDASIIATGTFAGTRPAFTTFGTHSTDGNTLPDTVNGSTPSLDANVTTAVRGDSLRSLGLNTPANAGLLRGDTDRDFDVDSDDLNVILFNFNQSGKTWGQGDVTDGLGGHVEGQVNSDDLNQVLFSFNQSSATPPPALAAVPEPATLGLLALGLTGMFAAARRRSL